MHNTKNIWSALMVALIMTACIDEKPEEQVKSAKEYLLNKDSKSALIQVKNALQKNPNLGEARYILGTILLEEGNPSGAEIEFRKALAAKHPESIVVPELARAMLMIGESKKLVEQFGTTQFNQSIADASLQTSLTAAQASLGKPELAKAALKAALAAEPNYVPALILRVREKAASGDVDGSLSAIDEILVKAPKDAEAWKLKGDLLLYGKNKPDDASIAYRRSIEADSKFGPSHLALIAILMEQNKLDEASKQLEELKRFATKSPQTKYAEVQLAYQKKDYKAARNLAQELLRISSKNSKFLQIAGLIEFQTNSLIQAENYLRLATQIEPTNEMSQRFLIATYLRSGQASKALTTLKKFSGKLDLNPSFYSLAGEVYLQNGDAKTAEEYFSKALKFDPNNPKTRTALARAHLASGKSENGFEELENISEIDTGTSADMALISAHLKRMEFGKALTAVAKLEAKQPEKPLAANLRGRIQLAQKDPAAARKSFEQALTIDPSYFAAAASLAALDLFDKKPEDAKRRFERLLITNPTNGQALMALAELAARQGAGSTEVAALLSKAVDANPTDIAPHLTLIDLHLRNAESKLALTAAQRAVSALPTSPELLDGLGRAQQASGELNQAAATFAKLASEQPLSPQPHLRLAGVQHANKNDQEAERSLRRALEIKPDLLDAQRGLILLNLEAKRYPEALAIARTVQQQRPKDSAGFLLVGDIQSAQKDWNAAAAAYKTGLTLAESPQLAIKFYAATAAAGKSQDADRFTETWTKSHPKDTRFLFYLAEEAIQRADFTAAEKRYLAILLVSPEDAAALNNLAWVSQQLRRDNAVSYAEKANQLAPNQAPYLDTWAMLLSDKGHHAKAIELQLKALQIQPANNNFRLNLAKIYLMAGEKAKARAELDALAKLGDSTTVHEEVAKLIKSL